MYKIVAIAGKAGSGKDTLLQAIMKQNQGQLHEIISCTTRPPREGEQDGVNYHFITSEQFEEQLLEGEMIEATVFRGWCYGTSINHLDENKINVGVFNPSGIDILLDIPVVKLFIVYVTTDDKIRIMRQLLREEHPDVAEIIRRYSTDEEDFVGFTKLIAETSHCQIENNSNEKSDVDNLASYILYLIDKEVQDLDKDI